MPFMAMRGLQLMTATAAQEKWCPTNQTELDSWQNILRCLISHRFSKVIQHPQVQSMTMSLRDSVTCQAVLMTGENDRIQTGTTSSVFKASVLSSTAQPQPLFLKKGAIAFTQRFPRPLSYTPTLLCSFLYYWVASTGPETARGSIINFRS